MKKALVTGASGMDGRFMCKLLHSKGYEVYGMIRGQLNPNRLVIERELPFVSIVEGDLLDQSSLTNIISTVRPDEVYNLGAISFVPISWAQPVLTTEVTGLGVLRLLEAIKMVDKSIKFYQASSSEMFGKVVETPQTETTPFYPRSPYGTAKVFAHQSVRNYRESYGMFCCSGICFNHTSEIRPNIFVTRKITQAAAKIKLGLQQYVALGNIEAKRDIGYAGDYVKAMWMMLQAPEPDDYVIATGETHSIKEILEVAFGAVNLDWSKYVTIDPKFFRPAEVDLLLGDPTKIKNKLGWEPDKRFNEIIELMIANDLAVGGINGI